MDHSKADLAHDAPAHNARQRRFTLGTCVLLATAAFYLWNEHRVHLLGALPYLLLLACPAMHLFMHRGSGRHSSHAGHGHEQPPKAGAS